MHYRVIPTQFCVAYQSPRGDWVPVSESGSIDALRAEAMRLNAEWAAEQSKKQTSSQRFVPPAQRRPVRYFSDDAFA